MALRRCLGCSALFAVGLLRCPLCKSLEHVEEGNEAAMPKITLNKGPTNAAADNPAPSVPAAPEPPAVAVDAPVEPNSEGDGETPWDGNSSSTSSDEQSPTPPSTPTPPSLPAPGTASPSVKEQTGSGSASPAAGAKGKSAK